jgi:glutamine amidotransferase
MIAIIDYRAGNLTSVERALRHLRQPCRITDDARTIAAADRVVFPGVGAAGAAMRNLRKLGLVGVIRDTVAEGKPFLGICLGYQILFEGSDEDGGVECLGIFPGRVVRFAPGMVAPGGELPLKVPAMGWNGVDFKRPHPVTDGVPEGSEFYFVHSYYPQAAGEDVLATATHGTEYACGVARKSVVAFQFHPEKSGRPGLGLLDSFCLWQQA